MKDRVPIIIVIEDSIGIQVEEIIFVPIHVKEIIHNIMAPEREGTVITTKIKAITRLATMIVVRHIVVDHGIIIHKIDTEARNLILIIAIPIPGHPLEDLHLEFDFMIHLNEFGLLMGVNL